MDEMQRDRQGAKGSMKRARKVVLRAVESVIFCHFRNRFNLKILHYKTLDQNPLCFVCHFHLALLATNFQLLYELEENPGKYKGMCLCVCLSVCPSGALFLHHTFLSPKLNSAEMPANTRDMCGHCRSVKQRLCLFVLVNPKGMQEEVGGVT